MVKAKHQAIPDPSASLCGSAPVPESLEPNYLGIDLGGTTTTLGLVGCRGQVLAWEAFATRAGRGPEATVEEIVQRAGRLADREGIEWARIAAAGIGSPGPLDLKEGKIIKTPHLKWSDVPLRSMLEQRLSKRVVLEGDAIAATYGEWWVGAAQPYHDVVGLTLGTGVGGGIILNDRIQHGFRGLAGHIGHMVIQDQGRLCGCGNQGCLESLASATAIADRTRLGLAQPNDSILAQYDGELDSRQVFEAARQGDALALSIFEETSYFLAVAINNLFNILNPQAVVLMGAVANAQELLIQPIRRHLKEMAFPGIAEASAVLLGKLGELAGAIGAAGCARSEADSAS